MNTSRASSTNATVIHIQDVPTQQIQDPPIIHIQDAPTALELDEEKTPPMLERVSKAADKLEDDLSEIKACIHRFPASLRCLVGKHDRDNVIAPRVVAIGPYHHGSPDLQKMEEVKHAAAHYLCRESGSSTKEVYGRVRSMAGNARRFYATDDKRVARLNDDEFSAMMFLDGCFLLQFIENGGARPFVCCDLLSRHSIMRDMLLLENQIPWPVLEALMKVKRETVDVRGYIANMGDMFFPEKEQMGGWWWLTRIKLRTRGRRSTWTATYVGDTSRCGLRQPAHLLDLLLLNLTDRMPYDLLFTAYQGRWSPRARSAIELEHMGVKLTASEAPWFADILVRKGPLFINLYLSPVFLNDFTACGLFNLAALESIVDAPDWPSKGFIVSSYLSMLAMLMDSEVDVQRLRMKHLLQGTFSDAQALEFFKGIGKQLSYGGRYLRTIQEIEEYKRDRPVRTLVNGLLDTGYRALTIATLFSIAGVLVGIFKILLSGKLAAIS